MKYEITIGIECHVQLNTKTKLFSTADNDAREKLPNSCASPIDFALPGTLPRLNKEAVKKAVIAGLALNSEIALTSRFDRKHYFYPDLPKGYQISQLYQPIIGAGYLTLPSGTKVRIHHAHLEEDAGKLTHFNDYSLVDLNRAGTPLIEIVSEPDIHSAADARAYCEELHRTMVFAGVTDGDLYYGNMRFDINISLALPSATTLGTRAEIKNLNSFKSVEDAVKYEYARQSELLDKGEEVAQETRGWSDAKGKTTAQRSKEEAMDYRYMPDPDIPPVRLAQSFVDEVAANMPKLPAHYRQIFTSLGLPSDIIETLLSYEFLSRQLADIIDASDAKTATKIANLFVTTLLAKENLTLDHREATASELIELVQMNDKGELSSTATKSVFLALYDHKNTTKSPRTLALEMNLLQENDSAALEKIIDEVISSPEAKQAVADIRAGEMKAVGFLIGLIMKNSSGKANPTTAREILLKKLK